MTVPAALQASFESVATGTSAVAANGGSGVGCTVHNASSAILYIRLGEGDASASDFSYALAAGAALEFPYNYAGPFSMILASGTGAAKITRFV